MSEFNHFKHIKLNNRIHRILVLFITLFLTISCSSEKGHSVNNSGLVYCSEGSPDSFNPQVGTSLTSFDANARVLFNRLIEIDTETGNMVRSLATSWVKSEDNTVYTFTLRKNVHFHTTAWFTPTRTFNSSDVVFSFNRQLDKRHYLHEVQGKTYSYLHSTGLASNLKKVVAINEDTVAFYLNEPDPSFLFYMTMEFASILSAEYAYFIQTNHLDSDTFDAKPIGTGPFKLKRYETDTFIRYKAHPRYMHGQEVLSNLVFAITKDPSRRYARLISGECDVMAQPLSSHYKLLKQNPDLQVQQQAALNIGYLAFNTLKKPLNNPLVRKALSHAINRETIIETVFSGMGEISHSPLPSTMKPHHHKDLQAITYDPTLARDLLQRAGYPDGFEIDLWAIPVQRAYSPDGYLMAELMKEDLHKIGVEATIISHEWVSYLQKVNNGEHQTAILGWVADNQDPGEFLSSLLSCSARISKTNRTFWCNKKFDALIKQAQETTDPERQKQLYHEAQELFRTELPLLPIGSGTSILATNKRVKNLAIRPTGGISFSGVYKETSS